MRRVDTGRTELAAALLKPKKEDATRKCQHEPRKATLPEHVVRDDNQDSYHRSSKYAVLDQAQECERYDQHRLSENERRFSTQNAGATGEEATRLRRTSMFKNGLTVASRVIAKSHNHASTGFLKKWVTTRQAAHQNTTARTAHTTTEIQYVARWYRP
jgi:hypothetical protein